MGAFSIWHILILAVILLLLFGGNRFSNMMGDVAKGLKSFKKGMAEDEEEERRRTDDRYRDERRDPPRQIREENSPAPGEPIDVTPRRREDERR